MEREEYLIESVNCEVDTFGAKCIETNRFYGKNNAVKDVKAHHYIISFDPTDNITMEEALAFGKEWLSVFAPGHQAVIAAHPDGHHGSKNMHVHTVNNCGRYDNVPAKVKAELFQISIDDLQADMKLHSLVLKNLNVKMYSSEMYDATDRKKSKLLFYKK